MNERFEKLMYESGLIAQGCWDSMDEYDRGAIEKFAELIVRECADMVRSSSLPDAYSEPCLQAIADDIEEHFGVEE